MMIGPATGHFSDVAGRVLLEGVYRDQNGAKTGFDPALRPTLRQAQLPLDDPNVVLPEQGAGHITNENSGLCVGGMKV